MSPNVSSPDAYHRRLLRVDLADRTIAEESIDPAILRTYMGGSGLGMYYLYREVDPATGPFDPANRLGLFAGPLNGTAMMGSGSFSVVTKGPMTGGAADTQANGHFGAYLKFSGYDGILVQGRSESWSTLHVDGDGCRLESADELVGLDTYATEDRLRERSDHADVSVATIGPAGEHRVHFAGIFSDMGHAAAHNGVGAVMGAKRLKAIVVAKGDRKPAIHDRQTLRDLASENWELAQHSPINEAGTLHVTPKLHDNHSLPVRNYTTSTWDVEESTIDRFRPEYLQDRFEVGRKVCFRCPMHHCELHEIPDGEYAGVELEEPEYEQISAWSSQIDNTDVDATWMLSGLVDRLGMDTNEAGWVVGLAMECAEKGLLEPDTIGDMDVSWGNVEAARELLERIAHREGIGDTLAEGAMAAAATIGGGAEAMAVGTEKGTTPRGHDHRVRRWEQVDTAVSNTGTKESSTQFYPRDGPDSVGRLMDQFEEHKGKQQFEDSMVTCRFHTRTDIPHLADAATAATGWDIAPEEATRIGRRILHLTRAFNVRHGIVGRELDRPSPRYGSAPDAGPLAGTTWLDDWDAILDAYYRIMGWDHEGRPTPETLAAFDLEHVATDLFG